MKIINKHFLFYFTRLLIGFAFLFIECNCKPQDPNIPTKVNEPTLPPAPPFHNSTITEEMIEKATTAGYLFLAKKLRELQRDPQVNMNELNVNKNNQTALHEAAQWGTREIVQTLLANKATNIPDKNGNQPLDVLVETLAGKPAHQMANYLSTAQLLLEKGGSTNNPNHLSSLLQAFMLQTKPDDATLERLLNQLQVVPNSQAMLSQILKECLKKGLSPTVLTKVLDHLKSDQVSMITNLLTSILPTSATEEANEPVIKVLIGQVGDQDQVKILVPLLENSLRQSVSKTTIHSLLQPVSEASKAKILNEVFLQALNIPVKDVQAQTLAHLLDQVPETKKSQLEEGFLASLLERFIDKNDNPLAKTILQSSVVSMKGLLINGSQLAAKHKNLELLKFLVEEKKVPLLRSGQTVLDSVLDYYTLGGGEAYKPIIQYLIEKEPVLLRLNQLPFNEKGAFSYQIDVKDLDNNLASRRRNGVKRSASFEFPPC